jgi:hypothetical protein
MNYRTSTTARERLERLRLAFGTDIHSVGEMVRLFTEINKRWNNPRFIKSITPPLDVAVESSIWEISSAVKGYFMTTSKSRSSGGRAKNLGIVKHNATVMALELATLASEGLLVDSKEEKPKKKRKSSEESSDESKEEKPKKKRKSSEEPKKKTTRKKGLELNLDEEIREKEREEIEKIYENFAAYLVASRITSQDISDLFYLSKHSWKKDIKEFCGPLSGYASLSSRLDRMWSDLDTHGIRPKAAKSRFTAMVENERITEYKLINGETKRPRIE